MKDGAPQRKSAGLTTATNFVNKSHKDPTANNTNTMILRLPITTDHDKLSQVKITHSNSLLQQDLEKWLDLELVDDVITDGNENAEFGSRLIADGLGMKQSLTKANWSTHAYENEHCKSCTRKHVDTKSPQTECFTGCITDDWLEPASDWNQWNEPAYVERMINLSSSLQSYSLNKTTDDSEMAAEKPYRSKIHKCLSKINYVSKVGKKGVKYCNRKNPINDRKISTSNSAAAQKTSQSNVLMDKCCTYCTDKATCGTEWQVSDI